MSRTRFWLWLGVVSAWVLGIQLTFAFGVPFHADEFQGAHAAWRLTREVPYKDFLPYKTLLGYVAQLPALLLFGTGWAGLTAVRALTAGINALAIVGLGAALAQWYRREAVIVAVLLLAFTSTFAEYAFEIRVDMLTGWAGTAVLLFLLAQRNGWAGVSAGVAFLVSQKGAFYGVAGSAALFAAWLATGRSPRGWRPIARFGLGAAVVAAAYLAFWIAVAGVERVLFITFPAAVGVAQRDVYPSIRLLWVRTVIRNPLFYGLAIAGVAGLAWRALEMIRQGAAAKSDLHKPVVLSVFPVTLLIQMGLYPQPWSYFFLLGIPILAIVIAAWLSNRTPHRSGSLGMGLPLTIGFIILGVLYPSIYIAAGIRGDRSQQRVAFETAAEVLGPGDTYWAGSNIFADRDQPAGLGWLDLYNLDRLKGLPESERRALLDQLAEHPPAVVIDNYRLVGLPPDFREYVNRNYRSLFGAVLSYVVELPPGESVFVPPILGRYENVGDRPLVVDGDRLPPGGRATLVGSETVDAPEGGRLQYVGGFDRASNRGEAPTGEFFFLR